MSGKSKIIFNPISWFGLPRFHILYNMQYMKRNIRVHCQDILTIAEVGYQLMF